MTSRVRDRPEISATAGRDLGQAGLIGDPDFHRMLLFAKDMPLRRVFPLAGVLVVMFVARLIAFGGRTSHAVHDRVTVLQGLAACTTISPSCDATDILLG